MFRMIRIRKVLSIILLGSVITFAAGCGSTDDSDLTSGIKGVAMIGPLQPVVQEGQEDVAPYADAVILIKDVSGEKEIARTTADENGAFLVYVAPGIYILEGVSATGSAMPFSKPIEVQVTEGKFTEVTVYFDSGIR